MDLSLHLPNPDSNKMSSVDVLANIQQNFNHLKADENEQPIIQFSAWSMAGSPPFLNNHLNDAGPIIPLANGIGNLNRNLNHEIPSGASGLAGAGQPFELDLISFSQVTINNIESFENKGPLQIIEDPGLEDPIDLVEELKRLKTLFRKPYWKKSDCSTESTKPKK
ncbi:unnamed protein product [Caenorhabditis bovis]|uniref:Uncharacterized protein n=1 Tax=Caenorhabditis bovis TaxID=2654633 RepID=A0A8S1FES4_9PELO|nr:unnamed protein product [Caenorhabditis bovis]